MYPNICSLRTIYFVGRSSQPTPRLCIKKPHKQYVGQCGLSGLVSSKDVYLYRISSSIAPLSKYTKKSVKKQVFLVIKLMISNIFLVINPLYL